MRLSVSPKKLAAGRSIVPITVNSWPVHRDGLSDRVHVGVQALFDIRAHHGHGARRRLSSSVKKRPTRNSTCPLLRA